MQYSATITSKRQLTIPAKLFRKLNMKKGDKVSLSEKEGEIHISTVQSQLALIDKLAGSVTVPPHLRGIDIDEAIEKGKEMYFRNKYKKYKRNK